MWPPNHVWRPQSTRASRGPDRTGLRRCAGAGLPSLATTAAEASVPLGGTDATRKRSTRYPHNRSETIALHTTPTFAGISQSSLMPMGHGMPCPYKTAVCLRQALAHFGDDVRDVGGAGAQLLAQSLGLGRQNVAPQRLDKSEVGQGQ